MTLFTKMVYHWTAGGYTPNSTDKRSYHYIIGFDKATKKAFLVKGDKPIEANLYVPNTKDPLLLQYKCNLPLSTKGLNFYVPHTGMGNTNAIGISFAGMAGFKSYKNKGAYPITMQQLELGFHLGATLIWALGIPMEGIFDHENFNKTVGLTGKVDISVLGPKELDDKRGLKTLDYIKSKVGWYLSKINSGDKLPLLFLKDTVERYTDYKGEYDGKGIL